MSRILFALVLAICPGLHLLAGENDIEGATPEKLLGGAENLKILTTAKEVTVFRVASGGKEYQETTELIDDFHCEPTPGKVSGEPLQKLVAAFSDMKNFGGEFMCDFDPGILIRFKTDAGILDMVVCFGCGEMIMFRDGKIVRRELKWAETRNSFRRDARVALHALAKKAFPDDPVIQALREGASH